MQLLHRSAVPAPPVPLPFIPNALDHRIIELGDSEFYVFKVQDDLFCFRLAEVVGIEETNSSILTLLRLRQLKSPELPDALWVEHLGRTITPVSITRATHYWLNQAEERNPKARAIRRDMLEHSVQEQVKLAFI